MKTAIIPAQITTVEDKITANLSLMQLVLITIPLFIGLNIYFFLPPLNNVCPYKIITFICLITICLILAIRLKGRLIFNWLKIIFTYKLRPKLYLPLKINLAEEMEQPAKPTKQKIKKKARSISPRPVISQIRLRKLHHQVAKVNFAINRRGEINVLYKKS